MNHKLRRFERVVFDVAPRLVAHRRIGLPVKSANVTELATLQVKHTGVLLHRVVLVVDHSDVISILQGTVVVKRGKAREIWPDGRLPDPPVEVHDVGMISVDQFRAPREPIVSPCRGNVGEVAVERSAPLIVQPRVRRAVEGRILRVVNVRWDSAANSEEEIVLHPMR